jgi:hypothetical protein
MAAGCPITVAATVGVRVSPLTVIAPFLGAAALEVVWWFGVREKLSQAKYQRLMRSTGYWVITALMVVLSGFGALILAAPLGAAKLLVVGAAFPGLLKQGIGVAQLAGTSIKLGTDDQESISPWREYFNPTPE